MLPACLAVAGLALIAACSSDDGGDDSFAENGGGQVEMTDRGTSDQAIATVNDSEVVLPDDRDLIKTGTVALESAEIDQLLVDLERAVATYGGIVESEDVRTDDDGDTRTAEIVVRVPVDRFETAVEGIAGLGTLIREQTSSEDVTTQVADIDARVASAQRSIASLQRLFDRAERLSDVIRLESELASRQADLESMQARQRALARQTALSTIRVSVERPDATPKEDDQAGFLDGIESGWSGLVAFVRGFAHVTGLVLPLGMLALVVAIPVWVGTRRLRRRAAGTGT